MEQPSLGDLGIKQEYDAVAVLGLRDLVGIDPCSCHGVSEGCGTGPPASDSCGIVTVQAAKALDIDREDAPMFRCARMHQAAYHDVPDGSSLNGRAVDKPRRPNGASGRAKVCQLACCSLVGPGSRRAAHGGHEEPNRRQRTVRDRDCRFQLPKPLTWCFPRAVTVLNTMQFLVRRPGTDLARRKPGVQSAHLHPT